MLEFFATSGFFFIIMVTIIFGVWLLILIGVSSGEFLGEIERKYGFKTFIVAFLVVLAILSCIVSAITYFVT